MRNSKYIKTFWNEKFFELPDNFIKSKLTAIKFDFLNNKINLTQPYIFLCNKTTYYDKKLISNALKGTYVFLKDEVIQSLYNGTLSKEDRDELLKIFELFKEALISVVIFPEKNLTMFGKTGHIPVEITDFIRETKYDIKFISLVGTYFAMPIWAKEFRHCETRFHHQFTVQYEHIADITKNEFNDVINNYMPSSATVYSYKYSPYIRSNKKAHDLETLIYCCPNCKKFFTVYSEFNCLKCKECGTAVEFSTSGNIMLSSNVTDLDSFADFQFETLKNIFFDDKKPMIEYSQIKVMTKTTDKLSGYMGIAAISIFCNKIEIRLLTETLTYKLIDIKDVEFDRNNTMILTLFDNQKIYISGNKKENFYIISDLHKIIHNKKD